MREPDNRTRAGGLPAGEDDGVNRFRESLAATGVNPDTVRLFRMIILEYYRKAGRDLPWRRTTDPYRILVSEIMLQQTQVERVVRKYPEFLAAFPSCRDLASAPLARVLAAWQGMGYNRRAISLHQCAQRIEEEFSGILPDDEATLATFPGIGPATAGSIVAFAFNSPSVFIETNIRRVFIHFFFAGREKVADAEILPLIRISLDLSDPRTWYWALMDYGTALKSSVPNPNRRSAHYSRQPAFSGSDRQIRGAVLRLLLSSPCMSEAAIMAACPAEPSRVAGIIAALASEGFICCRNGLWTLAG